MSVRRIRLYGSGLVDRQRVSVRRVGLYGSGHGDKRGLLDVLDLYWSDLLDCLGLALLIGKGVYEACWTV